MPPTQETSVPTTGTGPGTIVLVAIVLLLVGAGAVALYVYRPSMDSALQPTAEVQSIQDLIKQGDYSRATMSAQEIAAATTDANAYLTAQRLEAYSRFMTGLLEERLAAVQLTIDSYHTNTQEGNVRRQARDISRLLEYVTASRDKAVFDAVFSGPFATYNMDGDLAASLTALANYGMSLSPTTIAAFTSTVSHLYPLNNFDKVYNLTNAQKQEHVQALLPLIERAKTVYASESRIPGNTDIMGPARYHYWLGSLYGAMATVDSQYLDESETAYQEIFNYYDSARDENGKPYPLIESRLPMADYNWALYIHKVTGTERMDDIAMHLDRLITRVQANPSNYENQFLPLIRSMVLGTALSQKESFLSLADIHPPFAEFLASYGLSR